jgi:hypothetical protein
VNVLCRHASFVATLLFCCGMSARGQALADTPTFEVATVKPSSNGSPPMSIQRVAGARLVTSNTPLTWWRETPVDVIVIDKVNITPSAD